MNDKDYELECDFCNQRRELEDRKMYKIQITEILLSEDNSRYPHREGASRHLQICEHCYKYSALNEVLRRQKRSFNKLTI